MKKLILFDLDCTLDESKSAVDTEIPDCNFCPEVASSYQDPIEEKKKWDLEFVRREKNENQIDKIIPEFTARHGGSTCIDVTKPGIDKGYSIRKLRDRLGITLNEMIFIGDAIFRGGNDYPAKEAGVVTIQVKNPDETKLVIGTLIAWIDGDYEASSTRREADE